MAKKHPHILKICSDQHSPFVSGFAGDPWVRTPNIDRLAANGVVFDNHYAANPVCCPGRFSMVTGGLPREIGTCFFQDELPLDIPTYMRHFSQHGYSTICSGKMHFHGPEQMYGWQRRPFGDMETLHHYIPGYTKEKDVTGGNPPRMFPTGVTGSYNDYMLKTARPGTDQFIVFDTNATRVAIDNIKDYFTGYISAVGRLNRPLLFEVSYITPHCPFVSPDELFNYYKGVVKPARKPVPADEPPQIKKRRLHDQANDITDEMVKNARAGYWGLVEWMDGQIGLLLKALEELGVYDDFLITYTSDHGELAGERGLWQKSCYYEESARVPMIISGGGLPKGKHVRHNTSHYDLFPTLCDMANLPMPEKVRGQSMLPLIDSKKKDDRIIFSEIFGTMDYDFEKTPVPSSLMAKRGDIKYTRYDDGFRELFDISSDPDEARNRINDPAYTKDVKELDQALEGLPKPWRNRPSNPFFPKSK